MPRQKFYSYFGGTKVEIEGLCKESTYKDALIIFLARCVPVHRHTTNKVEPSKVRVQSCLLYYDWSRQHKRVLSTEEKFQIISKFPCKKITEEYLFHRQRVVESELGEWVSLATPVPTMCFKCTAHRYQMCSLRQKHLGVIQKAYFPFLKDYW